MPSLPMRAPTGRGLLRHLGAAAVSGALWWAVHPALIDDAFIYLDYARSLAFHGTWGLLPGHVANTATSPLYVVVLAALTAVVRDPVAALGVLVVVNGPALLAGLTRLAGATGLGGVFGWLAWALTMLSPLVLSSTGMEVVVGLTLLSWCAAFAAEGRPTAFAVTAGALVLLRPDLGIFALVLFIACRQLRIRWRHVLAVGALIVVPPLLASWVLLGSVVSDTLIIKQAQTFNSFAAGYQRWGRLYPGAVNVVVGMAAAGLLGLLAATAFTWWRRRLGVVGWLGVGGVLHFLAYVLLGVPSYLWYYVPSFGALTLCVAALVALAVRRVCASARLSRAPARVVATIPALACAVALLPVLGFAASYASRGLPFASVPIKGNWAMPWQYERIGKDLRGPARAGPIGSPGEIGTLAYYCECTIVDKFSDRGRVIQLIEQRIDAAGPVEGLLLRLNYAFLPDDIAPIAVRRQLVYVAGAKPHYRWNTYSPGVGWGRLVLRDPAGQP